MLVWQWDGMEKAQTLIKALKKPYDRIHCQKKQERCSPVYIKSGLISGLGVASVRHICLLDIWESNTYAKEKELAGWLLEISKHHGGQLLWNHSLVELGPTDNKNNLTNYSTVISHLEHMKSHERETELQYRVQSPVSDQEVFFDEIMLSLNSRRNQDTLHSNDETLFLTWKIWNRQHIYFIAVAKWAASEGHILLVTAISSRAASFDARKLTFCSFYDWELMPSGLQSMEYHYFQSLHSGHNGESCLGRLHSLSWKTFQCLTRGWVR